MFREPFELEDSREEVRKEFRLLLIKSGRRVEKLSPSRESVSRLHGVLGQLETGQLE